MKKRKGLDINFNTKLHYTILALMIIVFIGIGVFAYGGSSPATVGHSAKELDLSGGVDGLAVFNDQVNINDNLNVTGSVKIGSDSSTCGSSSAGKIRYNSGSAVLEYCDGSDWTEIGGSGSSTPTPDYTVSSNTTNFNLATALGNPSQAKQYVVQVSQGVFIGSSSTSSPAFTTGSLPSGSTVYIVNKGYIIGKGGNGGTLSSGSPGGDAISLTVDVTIDNSVGAIWSGGGGGGAGGDGTHTCGGGGGGGAGLSPGGGGGTGGCYYNDGQSGTISAGGAGGPRDGNDGGKGGDPGQSGASGSGNGWAGGGSSSGKAIAKNGHSVTWIGGNFDPLLKGSVA